MDAANALRTARSSLRLSQRALSRQSGVGQPTIARIETGVEDATVTRLNSILAGVDGQVALLPTRVPTVADWGPDLVYLAKFDPAGVPKTLVVISDSLRSVDPAVRVALCVTPPLKTGVPHVDALVAALVEWTLGRDGLPVPAWVEFHSAGPEEPWDLVDLDEVRDDLRVRAPEPFARRNVFVPAEFFESA
jgi:transcriptional regulator with XRE-family HTH domain